MSGYKVIGFTDFNRRLSYTSWAASIEEATQIASQLEEKSDVSAIIIEEEDNPDSFGIVYDYMGDLT